MDSSVCDLLKLVFIFSSEEKKSGASFSRSLNTAWRRSYAFLIRNKIALPVWSILREKFSHSINGAEAFNDIKKEYKLSLILNSRYQEEAFLILSSFMREGIDVIPLKSFFLAEKLYQNIAARGISVDLDFLIKEKDRVKAKAALENIGYKRSPIVEPNALEWADSYFKEKFPLVDLHWDITMGGRNTGRIEGLWSGTQLLDRNGVVYYEFMPEELLLYLTTNLSNSITSRQLRYLCDILRMISITKDSIDWERLLAKMKQWRLTGSFYAFLNLALSLDLINFPSSITKRISLPLRKKFLINMLVNKRHIFNPTLSTHIIDRFFSNFIFEFIVSETIRDYLNFLKRLFYPSLNFSRFLLIKRIGRGIIKVSGFIFHDRFTSIKAHK
ncbi:MAG: nucleotidyltransferase family protein [Candidatus Omnitrophota bacterium]